jgi:hypothetical protein
LVGGGLVGRTPAGAARSGSGSGSAGAGPVSTEYSFHCARRRRKVQVIVSQNCKSIFQLSAA